ncbi:hypothetical protein AK972_4944 [Pseudomonas yamanorum]|nr:hypothetical protein AK972_4944 [Pseudomonas yamanorum]
MTDRHGLLGWLKGSGRAPGKSRQCTAPAGDGAVRRAF